jgi:hypothetical protein
MGCNKSNRKHIKTEVKQNKSFQIPQQKTKAKHKTNYAREEENTKQFQGGGGGGGGGGGADEDQ